ncbi:MAG: hypothetical protein LBC61_04575 [Candidatus Peribacteria bacterium]|jgi:hypothetical protein|nr:hypothetical protein [Candidatus Peribacteria bacterium]
MKINIIDIFLDPSKAAKDILAKNEKKKIKITIIILASYALISILYTST